MAGNDALIRRLDEIDARARAIEEKMALPETAANGVLYGQLAKELGSLQKTFGPYRAYFNVGRYQDVIDLSTFTLDYRPDLEESYFWRGWAEYMLGDRNGAVTDFRNALDVNPTFNDAKTALGSIGATP